jgi:hypothetical protein
MGNGDPEVRLQLTCTGDTPPLVAGAGNVTDTAAPVNDVVVTSAGQVIVRGGPAGSMVGGGGIVVVVVVGRGVGELGEEHPAATSAPTSSSVRHRGRPMFFPEKSEGLTRT